MKKDSELDLMLVQAGRMLGDYEAFEQVKHMTSVVCHSMYGVVWQFDAEEMRKFKDSGHEAYNELKNLAKQQ